MYHKTQLFLASAGLILGLCAAPMMAQSNGDSKMPMSTMSDKDKMATHKMSNEEKAAMFDKMPDADYAFKPTPEIQTYGQRMAHVIQFNLRACSQVKGDMPALLMFSMPPTKAEVMAANKVADDECDSLFSTLTDADLMKTINTGRGGPRLKLAVIEGTLLQHANEVYGYMCVYLRLKGIVPPSSDRNER